MAQMEAKINVCTAVVTASLGDRELDGSKTLNGIVSNGTGYSEGTSNVLL